MLQASLAFIAQVSNLASGFQCVNREIRKKNYVLNSTFTSHMRTSDPRKSVENGGIFEATCEHRYIYCTPGETRAMAGQLLRK